MTHNTEYFDIQIKIYQKMEDAFYSIKEFSEVVESKEIPEHWEKLKTEFNDFFSKLQKKLQKNSS